MKFSASQPIRNILIDRKHEGDKSVKWKLGRLFENPAQYTIHRCVCVRVCAGSKDKAQKMQLAKHIKIESS